MIFDAMRLIQAALQQYFLEVEPGSSPQGVILENIAMTKAVGGEKEVADGQVLMTLVNLQEEATLKNEPHHRLRNGRTLYQNPPIYLNFFVLFSVPNGVNYGRSLQRLSRVIEFFQWRKELSSINSPTTINIFDNVSRTVQNIRILADLYSLTFEQLNYLWGSLGGKQVPFVLYRFRLVIVDAEKLQAQSEPITAIAINTNGET